MTHKISVLLLVAIAFTAVSAQSEPKLKPGKWRITTTIESTMMPSQPPQVAEQCVTDSGVDFKTLMSNIPADSCEPVKPKQAGSTITWDIRCANPLNPAEAFTGHGSFSASGKSAEGSFQMKMTLPGLGEQTITSKSQHEYLGKCD